MKHTRIEDISMKDKEFTLTNWYYLGFLNPTIRNIVMITLTLFIAISLILYVAPFKYALVLLAIWGFFFFAFLAIRKL